MLHALFNFVVGFLPDSIFWTYTVLVLLFCGGLLLLIAFI